MTLLDIIKGLDNFCDDKTIYASQPWSSHSAAVVVVEPENDREQPKIGEQKLSYFLEVFIAKEFLEDWISSLDFEPNIEEVCSRLIYYAENDA